MEYFFAHDDIIRGPGAIAQVHQSVQQVARETSLSRRKSPGSPRETCKLSLVPAIDSSLGNAGFGHWIWWYRPSAAIPQPDRDCGIAGTSA